MRAPQPRWSCEQMHQQAKEELGLDHFEGRSWFGLHHHTVLTMIAFGFLLHVRLSPVSDAELSHDGAKAHGSDHRRGEKQVRNESVDSVLHDVACRRRPLVLAL